MKARRILPAKRYSVIHVVKDELLRWLRYSIRIKAIYYVDMGKYYNKYCNVALGGC